MGFYMRTFGTTNYSFDALSSTSEMPLTARNMGGGGCICTIPGGESSLIASNANDSGACNGFPATSVIADCSVYLTTDHHVHI